MQAQPVHAESAPTGSVRSSQDLQGRRYAIVGGGVSGLASAWYLQGRGAFVPSPPVSVSIDMSILGLTAHAWSMAGC